MGCTLRGCNIRGPHENNWAASGVMSATHVHAFTVAIECKAVAPPDKIDVDNISAAFLVMLSNLLQYGVRVTKLRCAHCDATRVDHGEG